MKISKNNETSDKDNINDKLVILWHNHNLITISNNASIRIYYA